MMYLSVGLYFNAPVFTRGQLYVAVSRVTSKKALKILIENEDGTTDSQTRNIVWQAPFCWFLSCQCLQQYVRPLSHLCHYCGATHNGPIKHTDLVMIDKEVDFCVIQININLSQ
ncbi:hypothetical protein VPH35_049747 [Triticum aestivum]